MFKPEKTIKDARKVINFLGLWPSFHDAEILKVDLDREKFSLEMELYTFLMLKELDKSGHYKLDKECIITFRFLSIEELELVDFNQQNVISRLDFEQVDDGNIKVIISPIK